MHDGNLYVIIRVTKEEKEQLKQLAAEKGATVSRFIKLKAFSESEKYEDTMTLKETSKYLQVSPATLNKMCKNGQIKASQVENKYVFKKSDVEEYLEQRTRKNDIKRRAREAGLDELYTVAETADLCSVTPETIRNWARAEKLPSLKLGGQLRFRAQDIKEFISNNRIRTVKKHKKKNGTDIQDIIPKKKI